MLMLALVVAASPMSPCPAVDGAVTPEALAWLDGTWASEVDGTQAEERWTPPVGGLLLGVHREVRQGKAVGFEFLRVEAVAGRLMLRSMGGRPSADFTLVASGAACVSFERGGNAFPQRVRYWREGDVLHSSAEGGKGAAQMLSWARVGAPQAPMTPPVAAQTGKEPGPTDTDPDKYSVALENERVRVLRYHDVPGAKTRAHHHPDSVLIAGSAFTRRLTFPDGSTKERTFKTGDLMWVPAQSHVGENVGSSETTVLLVECKR